MSFIKDLIYGGVGFLVGGPVGAAAGVAYSKAEDVEKETKKARQATERAQVQAKEQFVAETKRAEIQNVRSVRQQIRQARLARGAMTNVAAQTGGMGGSALAGGMGSITSQLVGNVDYMSQIAAQNTAIGTAAVNYAQEMSTASVASNAASLAANRTGASTIFGMIG
jgi:hypothetical protein